MRVVSFARLEFLFSPRITYHGGKMQRVFRFTLLSLAAAASLTACGDKVELTQQTTPADTAVTLITVTPPTLALAINQTGTLVAAISAGPASGPRTVTWSSSNTAVATIAPSGNTVVVTGRANGTATISATVTGSPNVTGAAVVTVGAGGLPPAPVVFNIANVMQNLDGGGSVVANLANIYRQIDVTFNVDGTGTNAPARVDLIARCTNRQLAADSARIVATQVIVTTGASAAEAAEEAAVPITLSFNTAQLDSTNLNPRFLNGNCQIQGRLTTVSGQVVNSTNVVPLVLNNQSYFAATFSFGKTTVQGSANSISTLDGLRYDQGNDTVKIRAINYNSTVPIVAVSGNLSGIVATDPNTGLQTLQPRSFNCSATANSVCTAGTNQTFTLVFPATQGGCSTATNSFCINQTTSTSPLLGQNDGTQLTIAASSDLNGAEGFVGPPAVGLGLFGGLTLVAPTLPTAIAPPQTIARTRFDNTSPLLFSHTNTADDYRASFGRSAIRDTLLSTNFAAFPKSPGSGTGWISENVVAAASVPGGTIANTLPFTFTTADAATATAATQLAAVYRRGQNTVGNGLLTGSDDRFQATVIQFGWALDSATTGGTIPGLVGTTADPSIRGTSVQASPTPLTACANGAGSGWTMLNSGAAASGIPQTALTSPRDSTYRLRVFEWDALGNIRCADLPNRFGVDNQVPNPLLANNALAARDTAWNPVQGSVISYAFVDSLSGFINNKELWGRAYRNFTPNATNCVIPLGATCNNTVITPPTVPSEVSSTTGNTGSASFDIRNGHPEVEAYYTVVVRSADQAGNLSLPQQRTFLYDLTPPTIGGVGFPAAITGGLPSPAFTSSAADNVDLWNATVLLNYPATGGNGAIIVADTATNFGPTFDSTRVLGPVNFTYTARGPGGFIKQIYQQNAADQAPTPADPNITGAGTALTSVEMRAVDAAHNVSTPNSAAIPAGNVPISPLVPACSATVTTSCYSTFMMTEPAAATNVANGNASVTLAASIQGLVSSVTSPFSVVCFFYAQTAAGANFFPGIPGGWVQVPGGCQQLGDVTDAGTIRTWTYRVSWNPDNTLGTAGTVQVRAFGFSQVNPGVVHATQPTNNVVLVPAP